MSMSFLSLIALLLLGGSSFLTLGLLVGPGWLLWEIYGRVFDRTYRLRPRQKMLAQLHTELQSLPAGARVLDFGIGTGMVEQFHLGQPGAVPLTVLGIEPTSAMRRAVLRKALPGVQVLPVDITMAELEEFNHEFAAVVCVNVLYLLPAEQRLQVLHQFARLLSPNGLLLLVVPMEGSTPTDYLRAHYQARLAEGSRPGLRLGWEMLRMIVNLLVPGVITLSLKLRERGGLYHFYDAEGLAGDLAATGFTFDRLRLTDGGNGFFVVARRGDVPATPIP